ncbi:MAG: M14 family metallopeptidase [Lachnospiraceae bacterium]|nr:M14 family metallopeptidase [Lachnospiraceae bacterium]
MEREIRLEDWNREPGTRTEGYLRVPNTEILMPVIIIDGALDGPVTLITGGIHNAEYVGIEAVMELGHELSPDRIHGSIILIPLVNRSGFEHRTMSLVYEDGKNLNRVFPGNPHGSYADKIAFFMTEEIFKRVDYYIDLHCGDGFEILTPYVYSQGRASEEVVKKSKKMAQAADVSFHVISDVASKGAYNHAGSMGIPSILIERGCLGCWSREEVNADIRDVYNILRHLKMISGCPISYEKEQIIMDKVYYPMARRTGCWYPEKKVGDRVTKGELLGTIKDYFGRVHDRIHAQGNGVILYQVMSLCIQQGDTMMCYGIFDEAESEETEA